jgi:queuine tRNA-ribosyltransferase
MDREYNQIALRRTHLWAERCKKAQTRNDQALFGIVQGGVFPDLRQESAEFLSQLDLPGYAVGGLSIGEPKAKTLEMLDWTVPLLPASKPRYLMGVGSPEDLFSGVERGIDIFDCALPTRLARNGALFTSRGRINLRNAAFAEVKGPVDEGCTCYTCQRFSAGYLHHLYKADEILGLRLNTLHNLHFLLDLMRRIRGSILSGTFSDLKAEFASCYVPVANDEQRRTNLGQHRERRASAGEKHRKRADASSESDG